MNKTRTMADFDPITRKNIQQWLSGSYDEETRNAVIKMLEDHPEEAQDAFYTNLVFGTGGLRGIMGVGSNRMNIHTVGSAVQGFCNYLKKFHKTKKELSVLIGYDTRKNSSAFANEAASILVGNGIKVYIFNAIRPTPIVSFGCRYKQCDAAIMVTASHNSSEYNGLKFFWNDGAQILFPHDMEVTKEVAAITDVGMIKKNGSENHALLCRIDGDIDSAYIKTISDLKLYPSINNKHGKELKIIYTSLHGTGITIIPKTLQDWGFSNIHYPEDQIIPDGNFPTTPSPNPENENALKKGIDLLKEKNGDILIATDPDADRVGIAVMHDGQVRILSGNQIASICLNHICLGLTLNDAMPKNAAFVKTIVTTELFNEVAKSFSKECFDVQIGFKHIAEQIRKWEESSSKYQFIFGGEESFGYLYGSQTRDKDAIISSALICEVALYAKLQNKTMVDLLNDLYQKHGVFVEKLATLDFPETKSGRENMHKGMCNLQKHPPGKFNGIPVKTIEDFMKSVKTDVSSGNTEELNYPKSDILLFWLEDGTKILIRPSGTEPKIKIYCGIVNHTFNTISEATEQANCKAEAFIKNLQDHFLTA